jgi:hypothetical protein
MIGLQIMMPAGSWPPVPVRASSRHIRSWGDSGHAGHIGGTAAFDPNRLFNKVTSCNRRRYNSGRLTFHLR